MRTTHLWLATLKESPADAELISHQLMLRAGLIRKLASGLYTWLPLGLRVLKKVETIVREEMNRINGQEILMPAIQPAELWQETERWDKFGPLLLKIFDRNERAFCFGPTHEEVVTDLIRQDIKSYKQLPLIVYQIQNKFRDEIRPRFGVMRAREFLMKDAYSFHTHKASLQATYEAMYGAYTQIFTRLGLEFRAVLADTGSIGGSASHEFQVLASSGEDQIAFSDGSSYAANIELAESLASSHTRSTPQKAMCRIATPQARTIHEVAECLQVPSKAIVKTLIVKGTTSPFIALVLRGDHEMNSVKIEKLSEVAMPLTFASAAEIEAIFGCEPGFIGPVECPIPLIVDRDAACLSDFVCGANQVDFHYEGVNWGRDVPQPEKVVDLRKVVTGDLSPDGQGKLQMARGIEVGHIFQLGKTYSEQMRALFVDDKGTLLPMEMGCYGIGVSRIVAAAIEQRHDARGIIWSPAMAPFQVVLIGIQAHRSNRVMHACKSLYQTLQTEGFEVLWDDRDERPGVLFADMDLIGIPHRLVLSEKSLIDGKVEYKSRADNETIFIALDHLLAFLKEK